MRRSSVIFFLVVTLLAGAVACLGFSGPSLVAQIDKNHFLPLTAHVLMFCAAMLALIGLASIRRGARELGRQVRNMRAIGGIARIKSVHGDMVPLQEGFNAVAESVEQNTSKFAVRIKELEIQLKVATAERQHAQAIIYSISDAVLVTDPFDELVLANDSAARTFDFDLNAGRAPVATVLHDVEMVQLIREMRQRNSKSGRRIVEHQVKTPVGDRTFKVTLSCVADRGGQPAGVVAVLHDMTRERELAQMKNDFVSSVSHELRTPLASIKAYTEMLIDGEASDEKTQREFYEVVHNEANRLERLIDNILNISRIESGLVKISKRPQSLMVLIKEAIEVITPQSAQKNLALKEVLTPAFYQTLIDKDMLYQAVLNLVSNAVKYTPEGGTITVETIVDEANKKVITRISDSGVGIPPKDLPFVFDKFYRSEANNHMAKGTGLGLALVKHIIETVHHGRTFVESQVGKGSTFGFELDLID